MRLVIEIEVPTPTYAQVHAYLTKNGWYKPQDVLMPRHFTIYEKFDKTSPWALRLTVDVPHLEGAADTDRRMAEVLDVLALAEKRRADVIAEEILRF